MANWRFRRSLGAVPGVRLTLRKKGHSGTQDATHCGSGSSPGAPDALPPPVLARALAVFDSLRLRPEEPSLVEELQSLLASGDQLDRESQQTGAAHHASVSIADGVDLQVPVGQLAVGLALAEALRRRGRHE